MFVWKSPAIQPLEVGPPSPLLEFVAGDFAVRLAGYWPAPHAVFLTAPAARRHLVCLALALAAPGAPVDVNAILERSQRRAIQIAAPDAPPGLARALDRMGEQAWAVRDYERLLYLLANKQPAKILRHCDQIAAADIRALSALPAPMLDLGLARLKLTEHAAGLVGEALSAISARDGEATAQAAMVRWAAAENTGALIRQVQFDLEPEVVAPPHPGTERLRPLVTKAALVDAASRYKNCLRNHIRWACSGVSAYYEWMGTPGAVLEITQDRLHGWSLEQARLEGNKAVPEPMRTAIAEDLATMGVHVGRTLWQLDNALDDVADTSSVLPKSIPEAVGELFGD